MTAEATPEGAVVAVVSKGDPDLLLLPGRRGRHFPETPAGEYAGHHPADGRDAVERLAAARQGGATHLLIPRTSSWWLDHYVEFRAHLEGHASLVAHDARIGSIYGLNAEPSEDIIRRGARHTDPDPIGLQVQQLLKYVLPERCPVIVATCAGSRPVVVQDRDVVTMDLDSPPLTPFIHQLDELGARGTEFLVVPRDVEPSLRERITLHRHLTTHCLRVLHQRHVCSVFHLGRSTA